MNTPNLLAETPAIPDPRNTNGLHDDVSDCLARLQTLLDLLQSATGISANEATTVVYWAISTYGLPHLQKFPMLVVYGPGGTGKTTLLEILQKLCYEPSGGLINGKSTEPVLRDELKLNTTALIDEADSIHEPWMIARHSRQSSTINLNRAAQGGGWHRKAWNLFGATALHRRRPFKDPAVHSRAIQITKRKVSVTARQPEEFEPYAAVLMEIAGRIDWERVKNYAGDRIADTWAPLLVVDSLIGGDWGTYAAEEMEKASADLDLGHGEEPTQAVFSAFLAEALDDENDPLRRVELATIRKRLFPELDLTSWQIGSIIRSLGFDAHKVGGMMYAFPGNREKLVEVGRGLDMDDDWFDDEDAANPLET